MMGRVRYPKKLELVALSFFKSKRIEYFLDKGKKEITFPCFKCHQPAIMASITTDWNCAQCSSKGNLSTLVNWTNSSITSSPIGIKIFNPNKEFDDICKRISHLINITADDKLKFKLNEILIKSQKLYKHYN